MTTEEMKQDEWYLSRPQIIKDAIDLLNPLKLYNLNGKQCQIFSYEEPESNLIEDVTITIRFTGVGQIIPMPYKVFGIKLKDLTPWIDETLN